MKRKFFALIALTVLGIAGVISVTAQQKPKVDRGKLIGTAGPYVAKINLQCAVTPPSEFPKITITNNTGQTLPKGKTIYWQVNADMKGTHVLQGALGPGQNIKFSTEARGIGGTPTAWYFK